MDCSSFLRLSDGSTNDGYYTKDGIHLTTKGQEKLCQKLLIVKKPGVDTYCAPGPRNNRRDAHSQSSRRHEDPVQQGDRDDGWQTVRGGWRSHGKEQHRRHDARNSYTSHQNQRYREDNEYNDDPACYNCGETNHRVNRCRYSYPLVCRECGETGHKAKQHTS